MSVVKLAMPIAIYKHSINTAPYGFIRPGVVGSGIRHFVQLTLIDAILKFWDVMISDRIPSQSVFFVECSIEIP